LCNLSDSFGYTEKQPVYGLVKRARRSNTGLQIKVKYIDGEMSEEMPYPFADLRKLDKIPVPSDFSTFGIGDIVDSNLQDKGLFYRGRIYSIRGEWAFIEYFDGDVSVFSVFKFLIPKPRFNLDLYTVRKRGAPEQKQDVSRPEKQELELDSKQTYSVRIRRRWRRRSWIYL